MAEAGKLWFEMGVRDNVLAQLQKDAQAAAKLGSQVDNLTQRYETAVKAGYKVKELQDKLNASISTGRSMNIDVSKMEAAMTKLDAFQKRVDAFAKTGNTGDVSKLMGADYRKMASDIEGSYKRITASHKSMTREQEKASRDAANAQARINAQIAASFDKITEASSRSNRMIREMGSYLATFVSFYGLKDFITQVITIGGQFELQKTALKSILGDAQQASEIFEQTKALAVESPFSYMQLATYTKQLSAFSIPYSELYDTTKRLADMSAGLGVDMNRLILAYGQVRSASVLRGQELRQFTEAGIPMVEALASKFTELNGKTTTTADVFKLISERAVPFKMVKDVLWDMTDEGGKFYNMQYTMADTLAGKWSNLQDAWEIMLSEIAKGSSTTGKALKIMVNGLTAAINAAHILGPMLLGLGGGAIAGGIGRLAIGGGVKLGKNLANTQADLQSAILQKQILHGRKSLSLVEREILRTKKGQSVLLIRELMNSGKINQNDLRRLYLAGAISKEKLAEMVKHKIITEEQRKQIVAGRLQVGWAKLLNLSWKGVATSIKSAGAAINRFMGPLGWIMLAADAIATGLFMASSKSSEMAEKEKEYADSAADRYKSIKESIEAMNKAKPSDSADYAHANEDMRSQLEEYDSNSKNTFAKVDKIPTEKGKYEALKTELEAVRDAYKATMESSASFSQVIKDTKDGLFGDDITDEMEMWNDVNTRVQKSLATISGKSLVELDSAMTKTAKTSEAVRKALYNDDGSKKPIQQTLDELFGNKALWDDRANNQENVIKNYRTIYDLLDDKSKKDFDRFYLASFGRFRQYKALQDDLGTIVGFTKNQLKLKFGLKDEDFKNPTARTQALITNFFHNVLKNVKGVSDDLIKEIDSTVIPLYFHFQINADYKGVEQLSEKAQAIRNRMSSVKQYKYGKTLVQNMFQGSSNAEVKQSAADAVKAAKREWELAGKSVTKKQKAALKAEYNLKRELYAEEYDDDPLNTDSKGKQKKGKAGSKKDQWLDSMNARYSLLSKFISVYQKYVDIMGEDAAKQKVLGDSRFSWFKDKGFDPSDEAGAYQQFLKLFSPKVGKNVERQQKEDTIKADVADKVAEKEVEDAKSASELVSRFLKEQTDRWAMYDKWFKATGNRNTASQVAFGGHIDYKNQEEELRASLGGNADIQRAGGVDAVLAMSETDVNKAFGKDNKEGLLAMINQLRDASIKLKEETMTSLAEIIEKNKSYETQISDVNRELERQIKLIKDSKFDPTTEQQFIQEARESADKKKGGIMFSQFKEQSDWVSIFDDLDRVSTSTIDDMIAKVDAFSKTVGLSVEEVKQLRDALEKLRKKSTERNPFKTLSSSLKNMSIAKELWSYLTDENGNRVETGVARREVKRADGTTLFAKGAHITAKEVNNFEQESSNDFQKAIEGIATQFKALQDVLSPVVNLFDTLGNDTLSTAGHAASDALGSASSVAGGLNALGLKELGPWGAAAGAGLSLMSSLFALHDKAIQKEIDASKRREKMLENFAKNIKSALENTMGGLYAYKVNTAQIDELTKYLGTHIGPNLQQSADYGYIKGDTKTAITNAQSEDWNYYDTQYAAMLAQRDELQHQRDEEARKKKKNKDAIDDYDQSILEIKENIKNFAQDMAKSLYGIDFKRWAGELTQTLADAWASGANAVQAYKDKVTDILKQVGVSVITQKIMEKQLSPLVDKFLGQFKKDKGMITDASMGILSQMYDYADIASSMTKGYLDGMEQIAKKHGQSLKNSGSSSLGNAITSTATEETASLIASYLNATRADGSVRRALLQKLVEDYMDEGINFLAQQLSVLHTIEKNTGRSADAAESINSLLGKVIQSTGSGYKLKV